MDKDKAKQIIKWISIVWGITAPVLFALAMARIMSLETFKVAFAAGFVVWVVVATALFQLSQSKS